MKKLKKENLMPTLVLGAICLLVAVLLAVLNLFTAPEIERETAARQKASMIEVFPDEYTDLNFEDITEQLTDVPASVKAVHKETGGRGYAVLLSRSGYTAQGMSITVAISPEGAVLGTAITAYAESRDIRPGGLPDRFVGTDADTIGEVPLITGMTKSSKAFRAALADALRVLEQNGLTGGVAQ